MRTRPSEDLLREFVEWIAGHQLVTGTYADDDHPYEEWLTPEDEEMDFDEVVMRARDLLR